MLRVACPFLPKSKIIQKLEESCGFEFVLSRIILFSQPSVLMRLGWVLVSFGAVLLI